MRTAIDDIIESHFQYFHTFDISHYHFIGVVPQRTRPASKLSDESCIYAGEDYHTDLNMIASSEDDKSLTFAAPLGETEFFLSFLISSI
jgi:hypothetical protein